MSRSNVYLEIMRKSSLLECYYARGNVTKKNKPDFIYWIYSFSSNLNALLPVLSHAGSTPYIKDVASSPEIYMIVHSQGSDL